MKNDRFLAPYKISYLLLIIFAFFSLWQLGGGKESFMAGWKQNDEEKITKSKIIYIENGAVSKMEKSMLPNGDSLIERIYPAKVYIFDKERIGQSNIYEFIITILVFAILYCGTLILFNLYKFIDAVDKSQVFTFKHIGRLTKCGWYCVALTIAFYTYNLVEYLEAKKMLGAPLIGPIKLDFMFWPALLGLVLLTIGYAFKKGLELQQENELTV